MVKSWAFCNMKKLGFPAKPNALWKKSNIYSTLGPIDLLRMFLSSGSSLQSKIWTRVSVACFMAKYFLTLWNQSHRSHSHHRLVCQCQGTVRAVGTLRSPSHFYKSNILLSCCWLMMGRHAVDLFTWETRWLLRGGRALAGGSLRWSRPRWRRTHPRWTRQRTLGRFLLTS